MIDNSLAYARAMHPDRVRVAGITLMPFMLGHAILLTRVQSPVSALWTGQKDNFQIHIGDSALAIWICERRATESFQKLGRWTTKRRIKSIANRIADDNPYAVVSDFVNYVSHGFSGPKMRTPSDAKLCGAPMLAMIKTSLVSHFGKTDAEALNTPLSLALWDRAALLEEKGIARIWTEEDEELVERSKRLTKEDIDKLFGETEDSDG